VTAEYTIRCLKADGTLTLVVVRTADSEGDAKVEAQIIQQMCNCPVAELWTGDQMITRFLPDAETRAAE
jgi:hypothetical protein